MIHTFTESSIAKCAAQANKEIPSTEKIESVDVHMVKGYSHEYVMVVVTNDWYNYAKYGGGK